MKVWLNEHEVEAAQFAVAFEGAALPSAPGALATPARAKRFVSEALAGGRGPLEVSARKADGGLLITVHSRAMHLVLRTRSRSPSAGAGEAGAAGLGGQGGEAGEASERGGVRALAAASGSAAASDGDVAGRASDGDGGAARLGCAAGHLTVHALGPDPAPAVRAVEALMLRLTPRTVRLIGLPDGGASAPAPYPPFGALFVRMISSRQSDFQRIEVGEHPVYGRMLFLNGETQIAATDEPLYSASLVGRAVRSGTRRVCILGGGDCGVLREVLRHPVEEVVMVEIDGAVVDTASEFFPEVVGEARSDPRARIVLAEASEYLRAVAARPDPSPAAAADEAAANEAPDAATGFDLIIYDLSDEPLEVDSMDALCRLVNQALAPKGRVAVQCGSGLPMFREELERTLAGLERNFRRVTTREVVIPSFLEQPWVFAAARRPKA